MSVESFVENKYLGLNAPEIDLGIFTMSFSSSLEGFEVSSDQSFSRREADPSVLTEDQREILKSAMRAQFGFTTATRAKEALDSYRSDPTDVSLDVYKKANKEYKARFSIVTGIRNIRRAKDDPNKIVVDTIPVSFPMFAQFGNERSSDKLLTLAGTTSTSMILITADKKPRIIIQRRGMRNSAYIDVPGASASGYLDSIPFQKSQDGKASNNRRSLRPLTTSDLRDNVLRELDEELGIEKEDISEMINTAIVHSATNANNDFAFIATTNLTVSEVREKAKHAKDNIKLHPEEFREKFVDIEASPEAILTLVTKVQCPIPPTHTAALIAAGYSIMLDLEMSELVEKGSSDRYREEIAAGVKKNYEEIDAKVRKFYSDNPNMLEDIPQRIKDRIKTAIEVFKAENPNSSESSVKVFRESQIGLILPRDPKGFSPNYTPEEQGLLDFESAMKKVHLIA